DYYDYDQYYEDYDPTKFTDYYPENYEYYEEDQDVLKIKPKIESKIPINNPIQARNKSSTSANGIDYDYYEDNGQEDYYQLSNSKPVSTSTLSTSTTHSTKSSISILSFLFINTTSKPVEDQPALLPRIVNIPQVPQTENISDNLILKTLFSEGGDLFTNNDDTVEKEFRAKENVLIDRLRTAVMTTVQTTNLFSEEEYGNYTDMYYYDDFYDLEDYYDDDDDLFSYNDDTEGHVTEIKSTSTSTKPLPNLNIINVIATVSYNTTNAAPLATQSMPTPSIIVPTSQSTTSTAHIAALSTPSLYDNFGINKGDLFNNQEYDYYDNYFEDSEELPDEKEDMQPSDSKHPELKTPLNTTLLSLTIKELLKSPALIAGICGGLLVGVITALVLLFFIIYRMRRSKLDESPYVVSSKNSPIYGNFKTKGQNVTLMSSSSVSPNTNLSTGSTSSATTGLLNGNALTSSRLLKYANHSTSLKKSCSILSSDSSTSSPNHDGSFNYAYIKAPTKEFYA
ncbi:hypothetical protein BpHYR1_020828, partial [Brachionus plicatilis]